MLQPPGSPPDPSHPDAIVNAPPTLPGRVPVQSMWPQIVGITSIVLGALGVLTNCWGVVSTLLASRFMSMVPQGGASTTTQTVDPATGYVTTNTTVTISPVQGVQGAIAKWQYLLAAGAALQLLAAALLIFAGVALLRRKKSGVSLHFSYAVVRTLSVLAYCVINFLYVRDVLTGLANNQSSAGGPAAMSGMMNAFGYIGIVLGLVWGLAYPAFLVIWFNTSSVRRETATWG